MVTNLYLIPVWLVLRVGYVILISCVVRTVKHSIWLSPTWCPETVGIPTVPWCCWNRRTWCTGLPILSIFKRNILPRKTWNVYGLHRPFMTKKPESIWYIGQWSMAMAQISFIMRMRIKTLPTLKVSRSPCFFLKMASHVSTEISSIKMDCIICFIRQKEMETASRKRLPSPWLPDNGRNQGNTNSRRKKR